MVGNGADAEMHAVVAAMAAPGGRDPRKLAMAAGPFGPCCCDNWPPIRSCPSTRFPAEVVEPAISMDAAAAVVDAIAVAAGGNGWLWIPSYVVISIDLSSAHLCTCRKFQSQ